MKKVTLLLIILMGLFSFMSCHKKDDPGNHFSFDGKIYPIDSVSFVEFIMNDGDLNEQSVFQFRFLNMAKDDTTTLYIGLFDTNSNTLGSSYPGIDQISSLSRGIAPFAFIIASGIVYEDGDSHLTGDGGSIDIKKSGSQYTIGFNDISVGDYGDLADSNDDDDSEYVEAGTIGGEFIGTIDKTITVLSKGTTVQNPLINKVQE